MSSDSATRSTSIPSTSLLGTSATRTDVNGSIKDKFLEAQEKARIRATIRDELTGRPSRKYQGDTMVVSSANGLSTSTSAHMNGNGNGNEYPNLTARRTNEFPGAAGAAGAQPDQEGQTTSPLLPKAKLYTAAGGIPNTPFSISLISFLLGGIFTTSINLLLISSSSPIIFPTFGITDKGLTFDPRLGVYLASMALFHSLEFWTTATKNPERLTVDAFLLNNGKGYWVAHAFGLMEYTIRTSSIGSQLMGSIVRNSQFGALSSFLVSSLPEPIAQTLLAVLNALTWWNTAIPLLILGQILRSLAMIHAAASFSHVVARKKEKEESHVLVKEGVYRFLRHPSYTGFFYWALATQLILGNYISAFLFALVLGSFFHARIVDEEFHLIRYFGEEYREYKRNVGTWLPWPFVRVQ